MGPERLLPFMLPSADHQLGIELRLHRPAGALQPRVLEGMLRDLIGSDQSLLPPLLDLVGRPAFQALDPGSAPPAQRLSTRNGLLAELGPVYLAQVLERLAAFLDGYCDLSDLSLQPAATPATVFADLPAPATSPGPGGDASETPGDAGPPAPAAAAPPEAAAAAAGTAEATEVERNAAGRRPRSSKGLLIAGGSLLAVVAAISLAVQAPRLCRQLGGCGATSAASAGTELEAAARAATAVATAADLPALERAVADLERRLQELGSARLSAAQQRRRDQLQTSSRQGRQRLTAERQQARSLAEAQRRAKTLGSLPAGQQPAERTALLALLATIPAGSFSHAAAEQQRQRLEPGEGTAAATPEPSPPPADPGSSSPSSGSWSGSGAPAPPPRPRPAPRPAAPVEPEGFAKPAVPLDERSKPAVPLEESGNSNIAPQ